MKLSYLHHFLQENFSPKDSLLPLFLLLLVGLAGCGGQPTTGQIPSGNRLTVKTTPCSLLTLQQVEQVLKATVSMTPPRTDPQGNYLPENPCLYENAGSNGPFVQVVLITFSDSATAKARFHGVATLNGSDFHSIAGLGDQALLVAQPVPQLFVLKDNGILSVGVASNADLSTIEQQEQQLAQMAVQHM